MNFFRGKKRAREDDSDGDVQAPKSKKVVSWIKEKFNKLFKSSNTAPFLQQFGETPNHMKVNRYALSPELTQTPYIKRSYSGNFYLRDTYLSANENKNYEFKAAGGRYFYDILPEHIRKYGSGFLNSSGGILLAGIRDDGLVMGVYLTPKLKETIYNTVCKVFQHFRPTVDRGLYSVEFHNVYHKAHNYNDVHFMCKDLYVVEIHIKKGLEGEFYEDGLHKIYIRREASVEGPLPPIKFKELVLGHYKKVLAEEDDNSRKRKSITTSTCENVKRTKLTSKCPISPIVFDL